VTNVDFPLIKKFGLRRTPTSRYEEAGQDLYEWFVGARMAIVEGEEFDLPPPDIIEDDPLIIQQIALMETALYLVVTDDAAMLRKAQHRVPGVTVLQISCHDLIKMTSAGFENTEDVIAQIIPMFDATFEDVTFLVDTGSMETFLELHTRTKNVISSVSGVEWTANAKRSNFKINLERRQISDTKLTAIQLGYPQKGMSYRRAR